RHQTRPRRRNRSRGVGMRPGGETIAASVMTQVVAQAAQLELPPGADAFDLIVPCHAVTETRMDETEPRATLAGVDRHLEDDGCRYCLAILQRLAVDVVRSRLLVHEPDEPRRIP